MTVLVLRMLNGIKIVFEELNAQYENARKIKQMLSKWQSHITCVASNPRLEESDVISPP